MDRPLGQVLSDWQAAKRPDGLQLQGQWAKLRPIDAVRDSSALWAQFAGHDWVWDYLQSAPLDFDAFAQTIAENAARSAQPSYTIFGGDDPAPLGYACFWKVVPDHGTIEIGNVNLSPALQRTPIATEAFFLMIDWAFANGYRRVEWKCNALNAPSRRAAQRMGFAYEGVFRNHMVIQGRNRDTAWFAMTVEDWPNLRAAFLTWLSPENFDANGQQQLALSDLTAPYLVCADPGP